MGTLRNSVQLIGRPGTDPEVKFVNNEGRKIVRFNFATNERHYNDKREVVEETQWHNIVTYGNTAEKAEKFIRKGKRIAIEGHIQTRQYEDKDKVKKYITEIVMDEFMIIDWASSDEEQQSAK